MLLVSARNIPTAPADTPSLAKLKALAAEYLKTHPEMTPERAFQAVYQQNPDLRASERDERLARAHGK
jgi:hypothetical protein